MASPGTAAANPARVYSIAPEAAFLDTLAKAILDGALPHQDGRAPAALELPRWTIFLPTRRAVRALSETFLKLSGRPAMLLPRIRPIGDVDEEELMLAPGTRTGAEGPADVALGLPPAIGGLERRLILTRLVMEWQRRVAQDDGAPAGPAATPAQAALWAKELADLMDLADREEVDLDRLRELVDAQKADMAGHWQASLDFLAIITQHWPSILEERNCLAPEQRSERLIRAQAERLRTTPPEYPVIAAGSTGTRPATADLLAAIAGLPNGAVVLPGLDHALDEESWEAITDKEGHPEHPQYGLAVLLRRLGLAREAVVRLGGGGVSERVRLISEVMRPAGTTAKWVDYAAQMDGAALQRATSGMTWIDAPGPQAEAEVIALILREALETKGQTAALVTPDRVLARRVAARLAQWELRIDDSAGRPLSGSVSGTFMDLVLRAFESDFAPVPLMALLKHPLALLGRKAGAMRAQARVLELAVLRRPFAGHGLKAHRDAFAHVLAEWEAGRLTAMAWRGMQRRDLEAGRGLLEDVAAAFAPLLRLADGPPADVAAFARAHVAAAEALARDEAGNGSALWDGEEGEALALHLAELLGNEGTGPAMRAEAYPDFYRTLIAGMAVRPRLPAHPRLFIWGPLEARLLRPDVVVLGGLNEEVWPSVPEAGPWLSRPMMNQLGLPAPERRIGLAAHDVAQLMAAPRVFLTRSEKIEGAPAVPSRWLLRLQAILESMGQGGLVREGDWLAWASARDHVERAPALAAPAPCPPLEARPTRLPVTRIEQWIANPYAIFARDILRLEPLPPLAGEADSRLRGIIIHDVLNAFARGFPEALPEDIAGALMRLAEEQLRQAGADARSAVFWRPHLRRFARWFAMIEPQLRAGVSRVVSETPGALDLELAETPFTLTARADRIDMREDGSLALYDYKSGAAPTEVMVAELRAPQLPLEAAIATHGGFERVPGQPVSRLAYIRFLGRGDGGALIALENKQPGELADKALAHLAALVRAYADPRQPYRALRRPIFANSAQYRYDDYAHLARVAEWSAGEGGDEG